MNIKKELKKILIKYPKNGLYIYDELFENKYDELLISVLKQLNIYKDYDIIYNSFDLYEKENKFNLIKLDYQIMNSDLFITINGFDCPLVSYQIGKALAHKKIVLNYNTNKNTTNQHHRHIEFAFKKPNIISLSPGLFYLEFEKKSIQNKLGDVFGTMDFSNLYNIIDLINDDFLSPFKLFDNSLNFLIYTETKSGIQRGIQFKNEIVEFICKNYDVEFILKDICSGTLKSFFEILNFNKLFELIEKIIFFFPEWDKKVLENERLILENERLKLENEGVTNINEIEKISGFLSIIEKYKDLGNRNIQFGDKLLLKFDKENNLSVIEQPSKPKILKENDK